MRNYIGIDPSTKTGLVKLDKKGNILCQVEITSKTKDDPERFIDITEQALSEIGTSDKVLIEGFSYGSKGRGVSTQYGIGWAIRSALFSKGIEYVEVAPGGLKKFATGKGNTSKDNMILPIFKRWKFEHDSDNVRDAYVLAQIGRALDGLETTTKYQKEVLKAIKE